MTSRLLLASVSFKAAGGPFLGTVDVLLVLSDGRASSGCPVCYHWVLNSPPPDIQCFTVKPKLDLPPKFHRPVSEQIVR